MSKISYLRKLVHQKLEEKDLAGAVEIGEVLLREHWHNKNFNTTSYADDLFNLACINEETGNLERAVELFSDSATHIYAAEGEGLPYAARINNMATALIRLGIMEPAFFMLGNATEICRRCVGTQSTLYADSLYNLANAAAETGRRKDSARFHLEALRIRENEGHIKDIIHSLHSLAFLYESVNEYEKAAAYAETAMKHSAGNNKAYADACNYLAGLYENCKKYEDALPLYDQVLEITSCEAGREHSAYLNVALRRASLLALLQRPHEALAAHEEICEIFSRTLGTRHIFYANCLRGMAGLHKTLGNRGLAEELTLTAMKIRRTMNEDITPDITFLIRLYLAENENEKALDALIYSLMCIGTESPKFPEMLSVLAAAFAKTQNTPNNLKDAMEMLNDREKLRPILNKWAAWEREE